MAIPAELHLSNEHHNHECRSWQLFCVRRGGSAILRGIYHSDEDESVISTETPGDTCPRKNTESNNANNEGIKDTVDDNNAISSRLWVDIVGQRPRLKGLNGDIHRSLE